MKKLWTYRQVQSPWFLNSIEEVLRVSLNLNFVQRGQWSRDG